MTDPDCVCRGTGRVVRGSSGEVTPCPYCHAEDLTHVETLRQHLHTTAIRFAEAIDCADVVCRLIEDRAKNPKRPADEHVVEVTAMGEVLTALNEHRRAIGTERNTIAGELNALNAKLAGIA
jgi:hypothetical protein